MSDAQKSLKIIVKGAGFIFFGVLFSKALGYIFRLIVARMGTAEYGTLTLGFAIFEILASMSTIGLSLGVLRYVSFYKGKEDPQRIKGTILSALKVNIPLSIIVATTLFFASDFIALRIFKIGDLSLIIKIISFAIPLTVTASIFLSVIKAFQKIEYDVYSRSLIENLVKVVLALILVFALGLGIVGATISYVLALLSTLIFSIYFLQKKVYPVFRNSIKPIYAYRDLFSYSWPLMFSDIIFLLIAWTDTFMISYLTKEVSNVGVYNAALPTAQLLFVIPNGLIVLFFPVMTDLYAQNKKEEFKSVYQTVTKWVFLANLVLLSLFLVFPKQILGILFGSSYIPGSIVLMILGAGFFYGYLASASNRVLLTLKKTRFVFYITATTAVINIILSFILIPRFGIAGAAASTAISFVILGSSWFIFAYLTTKINPFQRDYIKIVISALAPLVTLFLVTRFFEVKGALSIGILSLLFMIVYSFMLIVTRSLGKDDLLIIKSIGEKTGLNRIIGRFN